MSVSDDSATNITLCSWNIMGSAEVEYRKKVTTATFRYQFKYSIGDVSTSLGKSDIICIQEMNFNPSRSIGRQYLPFLDTHAIGDIQREKEGKRNGVFYKKEKFKPANSDPIERAFKLMEYKRKVYEKINFGKDDKIQKAVQGKLSPADFECDSEDKRTMCKEVLKECKGSTLREFECRISRFKGPKDLETRVPKDLLTNRMAICCLEVKSIPNYKIVVISVHNYSKGSGKDAPKNYAYLLFDFVKKLDVPVLFAGDFNLDKTKEPVKTFIDESQITYTRCEKEEPRLSLQSIDFIFSLGGIKIKAAIMHDLQVPSEITAEVKKKDITNHNPMSGSICI